MIAFQETALDLHLGHVSLGTLLSVVVPELLVFIYRAR